MTGLTGTVQREHCGSDTAPLGPKNGRFRFIHPLHMLYENMKPVEHEMFPLHWRAKHRKQKSYKAFQKCLNLSSGAPSLLSNDGKKEPVNKTRFLLASSNGETSTSKGGHVFVGRAQRAI